MKLCIDCSAPYAHGTPGSRCAPCASDRERARNASPDRAAYRDPAYKALPRPWMACPSCGSYEQMTIDHLVPLARGGTNSPSNLRFCCRSCNSAKGAS